MIRMVRAGMLEALRSPFVETARLSGIAERRVVVRYALRNALAPTVQVIAQTAQWLVGGTSSPRRYSAIQGWDKRSFKLWRCVTFHLSRACHPVDRSDLHHSQHHR